MLYTLNNVSKIITTSHEEICILDNVNFNIQEGELLAILGVFW